VISAHKNQFQMLEGIADRWPMLLAELVGVLGLAYVIQAVGL